MSSVPDGRAANQPFWVMTLRPPIGLLSPGAVVIITDGYIEHVDLALVAAARIAKIHALVTRGGSTLELERACIPYTQLKEVPR